MSSEKASAALPHPRAPRQERGRVRVAALMTAAADLFVEKGFDATTMTEIAARARASIGTLYLFFPTKESLAQAILTEVSGGLSAKLEQLQEQTRGAAPAAIADALFAAMSGFLSGHPVYAALLDLPGDDSRRRALRALRRSQIAALFAQATPALPAAQAERLAVIVPQLMRIPLTLHGEDKLRDGVFEELRVMLSRYLQAPAEGL